MTNNTILLEVFNSSHAISVRVTWQPRRVTASRFDVTSFKATNGFEIVSGTGVQLGASHFGIPGGLRPEIPSDWATREFSSHHHRELYVSKLQNAFQEFADRFDVAVIPVNRN